VRDAGGSAVLIEGCAGTCESRTHAGSRLAGMGATAVRATIPTGVGVRRAARVWAMTHAREDFAWKPSLLRVLAAHYGTLLPPGFGTPPLVGISSPPLLPAL
jgi:hypothetical protein